MLHRTRTLVGVTGLALMALIGCGGTTPEAAATSEHLRELAVHCGNYMRANKDKMPASVDELKKYVKANSKAADTEALFVSPRDKEPYVIILTAKMSMPGMGTKTVMAHEKTGVGGRRMVAFNTVQVEELDDATFQEALKAK